MKILSKIKISAFLLLLGLRVLAAEGMWMPDEKGELSLRLRNATVMFGDMCSGVIVSPNALFLTNHHCAIDAIQRQSTPAHNLVRDGFVADRLGDEIPIPELNVKRLLYTTELTDRINSAVQGVENEFSRLSIVENLIRSVCDSIENGSPFVAASVEPFYAGTRYFLQVYEVFRDVRLVLVPPHSIAAFGGETDNWTWPRCSADFAFLRIYAASGNQPAYYSPKNRPLDVKDYATISTQGYQAADSVMTVGFPGLTRRYFTSWETEVAKTCENEPLIEVRAKKMTIWEAAMQHNPATKLAYSSKYLLYANFYKYSAGMNLCLDSLGVIEKKQRQEAQLLAWAAQDSATRSGYQEALLSIKRAVLEKTEERRALSYLTEALVEGPEFTEIVAAFMAADWEEKEARMDILRNKIRPFYRNYEPELDRAALTEMLLLVRERVPEKYLPSVYDTIQTRYRGDVAAYVGNAFVKTMFYSEKRLKKALRGRNFWGKIEQDPLYALTASVQAAYYKLLGELSDSEYSRLQSHRTLFHGWQELEPERAFYSDANFTMRKSFGVIKALSSGTFYTTPNDLQAKTATQQPEYALLPELIALFEVAPDSLPLCFISDNDITGGNSGSPVFNAHGELLGLAFDGNWEGMSGDLLFGPEQRAIHVDVRYILFLVKNWAKAERIYREILR